jgi:hypothetical protein
VKSIEHGMLVAKQLLSVYKESDSRLAKAAWNNVGKVYKNTL